MGLVRVQFVNRIWFISDRLSAVIQARDRWLAPMGTIIPDKAILYISAISDHDFRENDIEGWKNVYGYDMSCVIDDALKHAYCKVVPPANVSSLE